LIKRTSADRQILSHLSSGELEATVGWTVDDDTSSDMLRGRIEYRPQSNRRNSCPSIRFIQVAKTTRNGGADYDWQGHEQLRNILRTLSNSDAGIVGGYFVDHEAFACTPGAVCSPYFRDYWANSDESGDGFERGAESRSASLVDYSFGWEILEQISLESCARCVPTGKFLGCAEWGARWPAQGERQISPIRIRENPSKTFRAALRRFDEVYANSRLPSTPTLSGENPESLRAGNRPFPAMAPDRRSTLQRIIAK
jgi:hypothetical protein